MMFVMYVWVLVTIGGNMWVGASPMVATTLSSDISATATTIPITSTSSFPTTGEVVIDNEVIYYPTISGSSFSSSLFNPTLRGQEGTDAVAHSAGAVVRTKESAYLNASLDYKIVRLSDSAGLMGYISIPFKLLDLLATFFTPPFGYLGSGMQFITYLWAIVTIGVLVGLWIQLAGGRRV
jgi:hypothetical protein